MSDEFRRLSVRSVSIDAIWKLKMIHQQVRLPMALLIEDGIDLLWQYYEEEGYDLSEGLDDG